MTATPMDDADFQQELTDEELADLVAGLRDGHKLCVPGKIRQPTPAAPRLPPSLGATPTGRLLLSGGYPAELSRSIAALVATAARCRPTFSNEGAVRYILQRLCGELTDYLTPSERTCFLDAVVPAMHQGIREIAVKHSESVSEEAESGLSRSTLGDGKSGELSDSVVPDTDRASFYNAERQPRWVLKRLERMEDLSKHMPERCLIYEFHEFAGLTESELARLFRKPLDVIDDILSDFRCLIDPPRLPTK